MFDNLSRTGYCQLWASLGPRATELLVWHRGPMEELNRAISELSVEFEKILDGVKKNINVTSETSRDESLRRLEKAQDPTSGILARAESTKQELELSIARYRQFQRQLTQLEQIYLISEDLKNVVRGLEKRHKH